MTPFWRNDPLTEQEQELLTAVFKAHEASVFRGNISSQTVINAFAGSHNYTNSIAAALMTLGGPHAPIEETIWILSGLSSVKSYLNSGAKVPGWGNSFIKGRKDDLWLEVDAILAKHFPQIYGRIEEATKVLHEAGKMVFPNPSIYTAATALALRIPSSIAPYLFLAPRLTGWTALIQKTFLTQKANQ